MDFDCQSKEGFLPFSFQTGNRRSDSRERFSYNSVGIAQFMVEALRVVKE